MSDMSYPTKQESQFMNVQGGEKKVMKKILSVALSTAMAFSMFASVAFGETATTPQSKFDALAAKGILNGYPDGQAHLERDLTRAEFAKIVTKLFNLSEVSNKLSYKDKGYNAKNWAVPYIEAVTAANLMQGKDTVKGIFDYNGKVTVEEVATVLFRALKLEAPATTNNNASAWAKGYAQAVIDKGYIAATQNFKAKATRSLVVETAYAVATATTAPAVTSATATDPTHVYVTFADGKSTTVELTTALVQGVATSITFTYNGNSYTTSVTLAAPAVVSVTAPNAKQLVIKFNRAIDVDTLAVDGTLINDIVDVTALSNAPAVTPDGADVVLSADGTQATITFPELQYLKGQYTVVVSDDVKTTAGEKVPAYTTILPVADTTAPTLASVTSAAKSTTDKVYVTFSEPVKPSGIIAYVNGSAATVTKDTYNSYILTTGTLKSGSTYDVSLLNVTDYAGNVATPNPIKTTVTVTSDVAAPVVQSVTPVGDRYVTVTFNKKVTRESLVGSVRLLDSNGESKGVFTVITTDDGTSFKLRSPLSSLPNTGTFTGSILFGTGVKDTLGNTLGSTVSQPITFTKDSTAPTVVSATYNSNRSTLTVKFSEEVIVAPGKNLTVISSTTGVVSKTLQSANATLSSDKKSITFSGVSDLSGANTLRFDSGFVTDDSFAKNSLASTVVPVTFGSTDTSDSTRPTVSGVTYSPARTSTVAADIDVTFNVNDNSGLNIATILDINSYTLDSKALPSGSYVTLSSGTTAGGKGTTATVHIPKSAISESKEYNFIINGIADTAGNGVIAVSTPVYLRDRVSPTLSSAAVSSGDKTVLVVSFSEDVQDFNADDLIFKINDTVTTPIQANVKAVASGTDKGKFYFTFAKSATDNTARDLNANDVNSITVEVKANVDATDPKDKFTNSIKDIEGNAVVTGTVVTAK
ncbi:S-layer homology domain-containing protein [Paenibacillus zanthoxyli]|uniref:S-layer homology domain-containing protein n=1 Tax=Paenibacillus zanthoxyli TaxID=369399 RepID=UPI00046F8543|nr:S-layer homology domain-containing protein [Paenibacillus zanthoxyli]